MVLGMDIGASGAETIYVGLLRQLAQTFRDTITRRDQTTRNASSVRVAKRRGKLTIAVRQPEME
jgi:hypothetical protein